MAARTGDRLEAIIRLVPDQTEGNQRMVESLQASQAQIVFSTFVIGMAFKALHYILEFSMQTVPTVNLFTNIRVAVHAQVCLQTGQRLVTETALLFKIRMRLITCQHDLRIPRDAQIAWAECQPTLAPDRQTKSHQQYPKYQHAG